ncbi:hypothetical protein [Niallia sp.]|uniref:hypothetical protein n=1 Tax=Niallia sp. TaxID=2837523 RepID=UPI0028997DC1|nr:hypothetical protein [Niallia sp.]
MNRILWATFIFIVLFLSLAIMSTFEVLNQPAINGIFSILLSIFILFLLDSFLHLLSNRETRWKKKHYKSLLEWMDDGGIGSTRLEQSLFKDIKPKYNLVDNLELIQETFTKVDRKKRNLLLSYFKAQRNAVTLNTTLMAIFSTMFSGILLYLIQNPRLFNTELMVNEEVDFIVKLVTWLFFFIIVMSHLVKMNKGTSTKNELYIEILERLK